MTVARETVRLELPFPDRRLSPNARVHWRTKAKVVADYREAVLFAALYEKQVGAGMFPRLPVPAPVRARVTFVVPNRHKRDTDNLLAMLKPAWDGLRDAGVLVGDDSTVFSVESTEVAVGKPISSRIGYRVRESKVIVVLTGAS